MSLIVVGIGYGWGTLSGEVKSTSEEALGIEETPGGSQTNHASRSRQDASYTKPELFCPRLHSWPRIPTNTARLLRSRYPSKQQPKCRRTGSRRHRSTSVSTVWVCVLVLSSLKPGEQRHQGEQEGKEGKEQEQKLRTASASSLV